MAEQPNDDINWEQALANCAKEPIHIPGAVQSHGALLAFNSDLSTLLVASENCDQFLQQPLATLLAEPLAETLPSCFLAELERTRQRLGYGYETDSFEYTFAATAIDAFCTVYQLRQSNGQRLLVVEIEPLYVKLAGDFTSTVRHQFDRLRGCKTEQQTLEQLVRSAAEISDFERILVYRFDSEWNGEVVAEHLQEDNLDSYVGQHFPASDIPSQVRDMYHVNAVRKIASSTAPPHQLLQNPALEQALEPLDLSQGTLRAVSPMHAGYMQNMGVSRSLSVAIFDENRLWGLLSCHGVRPARTNPYQRHALHSLVLMASQRLMLQRQYQAIAFLDRVEESRKALLDPDKDIMAPAQLLASQGKHWLNLFQVETVVLAHGKDVSHCGEELELWRVSQLVEWLHKYHWVTGLFSSRDLADSDCAEIFRGSPFCGLLAVSMPYEKKLNGWLLMLRREAVEVKSWAGRPEKTETQQFQGKTVLSPRRSFASWQETLKGRSLEWTDEQKQAARTLAEDLAIGASAYQIEELNERLQQANKRLEHLVHTDALTQLWNRYHMEQTLDTELSRAQRHQHALSVIIFDIDNFKQVNDTYGHDVGDQVLKGIAKALKPIMRDTDALGRWGGEEFLVIVPESDLAQARELAERLRQVLMGLEFDKAGVVTASFGVASLDAGDSRSKLIRRADQALYRAKNQGRNRVAAEQ